MTTTTVEKQVATQPGPEIKPLCEALHERTLRLEVLGAEHHIKVRVGNVLLSKDDGTTARAVDADMHFIFYEMESPDRARPVTFCFNGGPGSSSVWLHLGVFGPLRVAFGDAGATAPLPPYNLIPSDGTLLAESDLVFVDPVGTGFSRRAAHEKSERFFSVEDDLAASADFVVEFIRRFGLWNREKNLAGESYGGLRVAGVLEKLLDRGVAIAHAILISPALDYAALDEGLGNVLPSALALPSYAATAVYHRRINQPAEALHEHLAAVRTFARTSYLSTLVGGAAISSGEYLAVAKRVAAIVGLESDALVARSLDIPVSYFCAALLRGEGHVVGRLDARFRGVAARVYLENAEDDPSFSFVTPAFAGALNELLRQRLGVENSLEYQIFSADTHKQWRFAVEKDRAGGFPNMVPALRRALLRSPQTRVFTAAGLYDLATPFFSIEYSLAQLGRENELQARLQYELYPAGHMMYLHDESRVKMRSDIVSWLRKAK